MDAIALIVTALGTGATASALEALKDDVRDKAKAAYTVLVRENLARIRRAAQDHSDATLAPITSPSPGSPSGSETTAPA